MQSAVFLPESETAGISPGRGPGQQHPQLPAVIQAQTHPGTPPQRPPGASLFSRLLQLPSVDKAQTHLGTPPQQPSGALPVLGAPAAPRCHRSSDAPWNAASAASRCLPVLKAPAVPRCHRSSDAPWNAASAAFRCLPVLETPRLSPADYARLLPNTHRHSTLFNTVDAAVATVGCSECSVHFPKSGIEFGMNNGMNLVQKTPSPSCPDFHLWTRLQGSNQTRPAGVCDIHKLAVTIPKLLLSVKLSRLSPLRDSSCKHQYIARRYHGLHRHPAWQQAVSTEPSQRLFQALPSCTIRRNA